VLHHCEEGYYIGGEGMYISFCKKKPKKHAENDVWIKITVDKNKIGIKNSQL
jgi:hypothetical protein